MYSPPKRLDVATVPIVSVGRPHSAEQRHPLRPIERDQALLGDDARLGREVAEQYIAQRLDWKV